MSLLRLSPTDCNNVSAPHQLFILRSPYHPTHIFHPPHIPLIPLPSLIHKFLCSSCNTITVCPFRPMLFSTSTWTNGALAHSLLTRDIFRLTTHIRLPRPCPRHIGILRIFNPRYRHLMSLNNSFRMSNGQERISILMRLTMLS